MEGPAALLWGQRSTVWVSCQGSREAIQRGEKSPQVLHFELLQLCLHQLISYPAVKKLLECSEVMYYAVAFCQFSEDLKKKKIKALKFLLEPSPATQTFISISQMPKHCISHHNSLAPTEEILYHPLMFSSQMPKPSVA